MRWHSRITLERPLRDVMVATAARRMAGEAADEDAARKREQEAFERGLLEGEKRASQNFVAQRIQWMQLQKGVFESLRDAARQVVQQSEAALIELALEAARKLVSDLPVSAEMVEAAIRSALAQVKDATEFNIYLHGDDLALLRECQAEILSPVPGRATMHFHVSPEVTRGGCLVETRFGTIDARRETKFELLQHSLRT